MAEQPLSPQLASRFFRGTTTPVENRDVVRRLLLDGPGALPEPATASYGGVFERLLVRAETENARLGVERGGAEDRFCELETQTRLEPEHLERLIRLTPSFHNRSLAQMLCARSFEAGVEDPERALHLARLAVMVATHAARPDDRLDADLLGAVWAQLGNALRIASRLHEAADALATAARHLDAGTGDALARARLLGLEATLAKDRSQLREGIARCRKAARLFARIGDNHWRGKMLLVEAELHARGAQLPAAIACLDRALAAIDLAAEPRLGLVLLHNLASYLDQQERCLEAWQRLEQARPLAEAHGGRLDRVRLRWLEGRIAGHLGRTAHAESCLREARTIFVELAISFDAALVALELSALLVREGRHAEVLALVEEMVPVFESQELHGEAQAALRVFADAARARSAGVELIGQIVERLEKAHRGFDMLTL